MNFNSVLLKQAHVNVKNYLKLNNQYLRLCRRNLHFSRISNSVQSEQLNKIDETPEKQQQDDSDKKKKFQSRLLNGPNLKDFFKDENLKSQDNLPEEQVVPYLQDINKYGARRKVYFEVHGCQMNVNDTEIIWSILKKEQFLKTTNLHEADVVLMVTCAIREGAETKIWNRLDYLRGLNNSRKKIQQRQFKIGILGCMAERLKQQVLEKDHSVDVVAGPDSYRDLPRLLALTDNNQKSINVLLSLDETYADIMPVRLNENSITAFVSIMRGCDNMCTYCIVPFTRGRERSRPIDSIQKEIEFLSEQGVKEITLLGQNVNSYRDLTTIKNRQPTQLTKGFRTVYKTKLGGARFADLLDKVADFNPEIRIRFTSPHPKDFPDDVLDVIRSKPNICKNLHIPAQSGNTGVLERMRRGYTREAYLELIENVRKRLRDVSLSSDFICGFCGETDEEFEDTISLMNIVKYNTAYLFPYSMREKTTAHRRYMDDVPAVIKQQRLERMIETYRYHADRLNRNQIGKVHLVLIEGYSRRSNAQLSGRNDHNIKVIISDGEVPQKDGGNFKNLQPGDYVAVQINTANSQVLKGIPLYYTTLTEFYSQSLDFIENYGENSYSMM